MTNEQIKEQESKNPYHNKILPKSAKFMLSDMKPLEDFVDRGEWCALHDAAISNVIEQLKIFATNECYTHLATSSLFPERMAKIVCRLTEQYLHRNNYHRDNTQSDAVALIEWISKNAKHLDTYGKWWCSKDGELRTTTQLYELFKAERNG